MPDIVTGQVFSDGEKGLTATKFNNIIANSVIQPDFVTAKPASSTLDPTDQLLEVKGAGTYARITGQQLIDSVSASVTQNITPTIWSVRLRSFQALGNNTFEVDQRNVGGTFPNPPSGTLIQDRWAQAKAGTMVCSFGQNSAAANEVLLPGTNFAITSKFHRVTLTTAQATLGTSDQLLVFTQSEGPRFRELQYDVHSISLLVRSSVSGLKFGLAIRDSPSTKSLLKLCTIPSANTWTLIQLPNLSVFPAGNFSSAPGVLSYTVGITLAAGTTLTAPANDTWQNGNFIGALGQDSFASKTVGSTFDIAYVGHEPGSVCSTLQDKPFEQNLDECLRYYTKSYLYSTGPGSVTTPGVIGMNAPNATTVAFGPLSFRKVMAKTPTVTLYNYATGAANSVQDQIGTNHASATAGNIGDAGFPVISFTTATSGPMVVYAHYIADTGW